LNFFWGVGAILSQPFVDYLARGTNISTPTVVLSIVLFAIGAMLVLMPKDIEQKPVAGDDEQIDFSTPIWTNPVAWMIAAFNFIHVGFESAMGGWLKTYTQRVEPARALVFCRRYFCFSCFSSSGAASRRSFSGF
jgi:fucose permease